MIASFIINAHNVSTGTKAGTAVGSGPELGYARVELNGKRGTHSGTGGGKSLGMWEEKDYNALGDLLLYDRGVLIQLV